MADDLGVFVAVAEEKGFRAAGRRLGVSGSAVSQTVSQLEERLGVALFQRTTRCLEWAWDSLLEISIRQHTMHLLMQRD